MPLRHVDLSILRLASRPPSLGFRERELAGLGVSTLKMQVRRLLSKL